jgi:hypothetical protein
VTGYHFIYTCDGGHDGLLPGRWLATYPVLDQKLFTYAPTEEETVQKMRDLVREKYPQVPWLNPPKESPPC